MDKKIISSHILNIVQNNPVAEQGDLQEMLKARGHDIPQATLSRWLKKLNIAKVGGVYKIIDYSFPTLPIVLNIQVSDAGLIVLHTHPGNANSLAYLIDQKYVSFSATDERNSGIIGTIAGDDTVLVILKNKDALPRMLAIFQELFPYLKVH